MNGTTTQSNGVGYWNKLESKQGERHEKFVPMVAVSAFAQFVFGQSNAWAQYCWSTVGSAGRVGEGNRSTVNTFTRNALWIPPYRVSTHGLDVSSPQSPTHFYGTVAVHFGVDRSGQ